MKRLCYVSTKTMRVFSNYEAAYKDAVGHRFVILNESPETAREKAIKNVKIAFLWLDK